MTPNPLDLSQQHILDTTTAVAHEALWAVVDIGGTLFLLIVVLPYVLYKCFYKPRVRMMDYAPWDLAGLGLMVAELRQVLGRRWIHYRRIYRKVGYLDKPLVFIPALKYLIDLGVVEYRKSKRTNRVFCRLKRV